MNTWTKKHWLIVGYNQSKLNRKLRQSANVYCKPHSILFKCKSLNAVVPAVMITAITVHTKFAVCGEQKSNRAANDEILSDFFC